MRNGKKNKAASIPTTEARTANKVLPKAGVTNFYDTFVLNQAFVFKSKVVLKCPAFGNTITVMRNTMKNEPIKFNRVEFPSQGAIILGRLYLPENKDKPYSIIIMTHGFTATINGMVADNYAEEFCKSGFAVLLYDHLNFGISDGFPRQEMNKWLQVRGYIDAVVDKNNIALWGDSMSGGRHTSIVDINLKI